MYALSVAFCVCDSAFTSQWSRQHGFDVQGHGLVISILVLHVVAKHKRLAVCSDGVLANLQLRFASCGQAEEAEAIRFEVIELIRSVATAPAFAILYTLESPGFRNHSASQAPNTLN